MAALPKNKRHVTDIRPISIVPVIQRVWSGAREQMLRKWLHTLQPDSQSAYRQGFCAEQEVARLGCYYERAEAAGEPVMSVGLDLKKAFDSVHHSTLRRIMLTLGMPSAVWDIIACATIGHSRSWRLSGRWLDDEFVASAGVAQGCSLSVSSFVAYLLPLLHQLQERFHSF